MANLEAWREAAAKFNGNVVVWVDQSTDSQLLSANSNGVCHTITRDWINHYTRSRVDRAAFVNSFRNSPIPDSRIPAPYIQQQATLKAIYKAKQTAFIKALKAEVKVGKGIGYEELEARKEAFQKQFYGPGCVKYDDFGEYSSPDDRQLLFDIILTEGDPAYYMLSMKRKTGGGHVVGFEFRPDIYVSTNYPKLYEFFDANLGLFAFYRLSDMKSFFMKAVLGINYKNSGYVKFGLATFDIGTATATTLGTTPLIKN